LFLLRGTPESRSASASQHKLDVGGLLSLIVALVLVNLFLLRGTPESRSASASQHKLDVGGLLSLIVALV
ncbi:hypothetical protein CQA78_31070, partial [Klebsiella pneumoniae]